MPLPSAPASISLNQVNVELGLSGTATITLNDTAVRSLFGKPTNASQISMSDGYGKSSFYKTNLTKGIFGGGSNGNALSTTDKITYSTESRSALTSGNALSQARWTPTGAGNDTKGFISGGFNPGPGFSLVADRATFSTEAIAAVTGANLTLARDSPAGTGNVDKGFFGGGGTQIGSSFTTPRVDRTTYSTESTAAVPGAYLIQPRSGMAAAGNSTKGFFMAGRFAPSFPGGTIVTTAERTTYSTETTASVSGANLIQARRYLAAAGNADKGFFSGGETPTYVATAERTTYSTETSASVSGANLSSARQAPTGAGDSNKGFFAGGFTQTPAITAVTTSDKTTYSTETTAAVSGASLGQARGQAGAV